MADENTSDRVDRIADVPTGSLFGDEEENFDLIKVTADHRHAITRSVQSNEIVIFTDVGLPMVEGTISVKETRRWKLIKGQTIGTASR